MKSIEELQREIADTHGMITPLTSKLERLNLELADALSRQYIAVNKITRDNVEMSSGEGKPWFGTAWSFGDWMRKNSKKFWAEWNGIIYPAYDLMNGRMDDMPGRVEHLID